jgi:heme exporter protein C
MSNRTQPVSPWLRTSYSVTGVLALAALIYCLYVIFMVVPDERVMGAVQRIFYFHVASAISSYLAFGAVFFFSIAYLATREDIYDILNAAAAELGFLLCSITLASGMIWGHAAWNTWFRWEPRLVTFLLLWLISGIFLLIRAFGSPGQYRAHSAVLGILGALTVPLVWFSVKLIPEAAQLHPQVLDKQGLKSPAYGYGLTVSIITLVLVALFLFQARFRLGLLEAHYAERKLCRT